MKEDKMHGVHRMVTSYLRMVKSMFPYLMQNKSARRTHHALWFMTTKVKTKNLDCALGEQQLRRPHQALASTLKVSTIYN